MDECTGDDVVVRMLWKYLPLTICPHKKNVGWVHINTYLRKHGDEDLVAAL
jgi:hypothetical protein